MDEFGSSVISKVKGNEVEKVQVHGIIGKLDGRDFMYSAVLKVELGHGQMMGERIAADRRHRGKNNN